MNIKKSKALRLQTAGAVSAAETRREKAKHLRERDRQVKAEKKDAIKKEQQATKAVRATAGGECKANRDAAREARKAAAQKERIDLAIACVARKDELTRPHKKKIEELRTELRGSAAAERANRSREAAKPKKSAAEERDERRQAVENDLRHHRPELLPLWEREKRTFKGGGTDHKSDYEAFIHWADENPEALAGAQAAALVSKDADLLCGQAREEAKRGTPGAAEYVEGHCGEGKRRGPKGSAASRTASLFESGKKPAELGVFGGGGPDWKIKLEKTKHEPGSMVRSVTYVRASTNGNDSYMIGKIQNHYDSGWQAWVFVNMNDVNKMETKEGFGTSAEAAQWVVEKAHAIPYWHQVFSAPARKLKGAKKAPKGQQGLSVGGFGARSLIDDDAGQLGF